MQMQFGKIIWVMFLGVFIYMFITFMISMFFYFTESLFYGIWVKSSSFWLIILAFVLQILIMKSTHRASQYILQSVIVLVLFISLVLATSLLLPKIVEAQYYNGEINDYERYNAILWYTIPLFLSVIVTLTLILIKVIDISVTHFRKKLR